ncbi:hypothetical protein IP86_02710 [Rhodopseudomonas sp. AAP120]|uniref:Uncharacterized protein n=1 Tax=Rhodopseudomonas palustris (strain BisB5) TaxID=316057 RepID=Q138U4_RHOPS|nr:MULTISPECIES: hypothetical protein [Rhodopseudomonas]ABE39395.1 hypothetical protein RPD_2160 [Rhodopseudomonas palustris BisB5]ACF00833.1 hypothetical protein Rpal_2315 [Rhodopseudomonas palustris TIE-1]KPG01742.1 hypothetical protein IP86_02710 [Rhodopseudomonas sp. AAP120]
MTAVHQIELFDPRLTPTATSEMLGDAGLRRAIAWMRSPSAGRYRSRGHGLPYVERIAECGDGRPAWLIDDGGTRIVVVGGLVWRPEDLVFAAPHLRTAAAEAVARLDLPSAIAS